MRGGGIIKKFFGVEKYESIKVNEINSNVLSEMSHEKSVFFGEFGEHQWSVSFSCPLFLPSV